MRTSRTAEAGKAAERQMVIEDPSAERTLAAAETGRLALKSLLRAIRLELTRVLADFDEDGGIRV